MKRIQMIFVILLMCVTTPVSAQEISKTYCMSGIKYTGPEEDLKDELLTAAKQEAVQELFGEAIASLTEVENFALTEEQIRTNALAIVRIQGEPVYSNGQNFGEVCVTINAYSTEEDSDKFKPQTLIKKTCKEGDEKTIKQDTEEKAILKALTDYNQQVQDYPLEKVLPLLHDVTVLEGGFEPETEFYCAKVSGVIYPIELMGVLIPKPTLPPITEKTEFSIDLTQYAHGDIPAELGQNLLVRETKDGVKYICGQAVNPQGVIEIKDLSLSDSFELIITASWASRPGGALGPSVPQTIHILSDNGEEIKNTLYRAAMVGFVIGGGAPSTINSIAFGNLGRGWARAGGHGGTNTIKVVVKGSQAKLFINDNLFGTIIVKAGVNYTTVIVNGIIDKDVIYGFSVKRL